MIHITRMSALLLCLAVTAHSGESIRCDCTKDTVISSASVNEMDGNGGKSERMKMKIYQEFGIFDFDVSKLKGRNIEGVTLFLAPAGGEIHGKGRGTDLRWFTVSTIGTPWVEGEGTSYAKDDKGKGATFNEASYKTRPWCALPDGKPAFAGSKLYDVTLGNGNSIRCDVDGGDPKDGYFAIPVDKKLIQALVSQTAHGLLVMDGSTGVDRNCTVYTKDSRKPPYLVVTLAAGADGAGDTQPPAPPSNITVTAAPQFTQVDFGAAIVSLKIPDDCFALKAKLNGVELPQWMLAFPRKVGRYQHPAGTFVKPAPTQPTEELLLDFLPSDAEAKLEFACVDAAGNVSPYVSASGKASLSAKAATPKLPASEWKPEGGDAPTLGKLKVWAAPENAKIDPLTGKVLYEEGMETVANKNSVWDAKTKTVHLSMARGEIASFQLIFERTDEDPCNVSIGLNLDPAVTTVRFWQPWYVKVGDVWQSEYALPSPTISAGTAPLFRPDNKIPNQRFSAVTVDLWTGDAGGKTGMIALKLGEASLALNFKCKAYNAVIPPELNFVPEFNCYSGPGDAGTPQFLDSHRLAHYHRTAINRVNHSHGGNFSSDLTPPAAKDGRVADWTAYDKNVGPLLDGSAFADNPRKNVPVPILYLPMFEGYPSNFKKNYNPGVVAKGKDWKAIHDIYAKPVEQCFPDSYRQAFINCSEDFAKHVAAKGWTKTRLQCFQNNKHQYARDGWTGTGWMMDEPNEYFDWRALNYYAALFAEGVNRSGQNLPNMVYRADVSRPMWQGNCSDGVMTELYTGGDLFSAGYLCRSTRRRGPMRFVAYGGANAQDRANHESTAWCLKSYVHEADGVVPWQSLGGDDAFDKGDGNGDNGNALIVDGRKRFQLGAVASYRVHAFRSGAQLCELLRLLEIKNGWTRAHSAVLVQQKIPLGTEFKQSFADDAAAVTFKGLNADRFVELKEAILKLLEK